MFSIPFDDTVDKNIGGVFDFVFCFRSLVVVVVYGWVGIKTFLMFYSRSISLFIEINFLSL